MISRSKKQTFNIIIPFIVLLLILPIYQTNASQPKTWDENWSFSQQIELTVDTDNKQTRFQPVDIPIRFQSPCWAQDEEHHSIRLCCLHEEEWVELESQIYDLAFTSQNQIETCNIVFLIPEFADGTEEYFVYYDESQTPAPTYTDHVTYEESSYHYEPIPGYPLQSSYYEIHDDEFINYMISYEGQFMGYNTGQHIYKMINGTKQILPKNAELFAALDYKYCYEKGLFGYSSTSQKVISKEVITDGNLMIEIGMVSTSKLDDLQTTATYKYYHCPSSEKRIYAHVLHETKEDVVVYPESNTDGVFASMQAGGVKSNSIEELNIGQIFPLMHFNNELNQISEYQLDLDPEYIQDDPDIRVISAQDDIDLGNPPFISFDEGETGHAHALIFSSNEIVNSESNEHKGIQINAFQMDYPHLAGLENNIAVVQAGRNSVEPGSPHDMQIAQGFSVEFDIEFFSTPNAGYNQIKKESDIFTDLLLMRPKSNTSINGESTQGDTVNLSVFVHNANSFPFGSSLSAVTGINFTYLTVELYKQNQFIYSQNAVRIPLNALTETEDPSFLDKIRNSIALFDFRNISLFKKAQFSDIETGQYVIKIYQENPLVAKNKQFIGYSIADVTKDSQLHIWCRKQSSIDVLVNDQHQEPIINAEVLLKKNTETIASSITDKSGIATVEAPLNDEEYRLRIIYNGYPVYEETVKLPRFEKINAIQKNIVIDRYRLVLFLKDSWNQTPSVDLNPVLSIQGGNDSTIIFSEKITNGKYVFSNLTPQAYTLFLKYKSFTSEETIQLNANAEIFLYFPAEFSVSMSILDTRGTHLEKTNVIITKNNEFIEIDHMDSTNIISLPPGDYQIDVFSDDTLIGSRTLAVYGEKNVAMVTSYQPIYPLIITLVITIALLIMVIRFFLTSNKNFLFPIIMLSLLAVSFVQPWWQINGSTAEIETTTNIFLIPQTMITSYQTDQSITGEISYLPSEFQMALSAILITGIIVILLLLGLYFLKTKKMISEKILFISHIIIIIVLLAGAIGFFIAIHELSSIGVGGVIGSGQLDVGVPGEDTIQPLMCQWSFGIGFYLYLAAPLVFAGQIIYKPLIRWREKHDIRSS